MVETSSDGNRDDITCQDVAEQESLVAYDTSYLAIAGTFVFGIVRLLNSLLVSLRIDLALNDLNNDNSIDINASHKSIQTLKKIDHDAYKSFVYVSKISYFIYATTILDTFLQDTTLYLLLKFPSTIGPKNPIPIQTLISANSKEEVISSIAKKYSREISFRCYKDRIKFLQDNFGIGTNISDKLMDDLIRLTNLRNAIIHDQGIYDLNINESNAVTSKLKTCVHYPTKITPDDIDDAKKTYKSVAKIIADDIFTKVAIDSNKKEVESLISLLAK